MNDDEDEGSGNKRGEGAGCEKNAEAETADGDERNEFVPLVERPGEPPARACTNEKKIQEEGQGELLFALVVRCVKQHVCNCHGGLYKPRLLVGGEVHKVRKRREQVHDRLHRVTPRKGSAARRNLHAAGPNKAQKYEES